MSYEWALEIRTVFMDRIFRSAFEDQSARHLDIFMSSGLLACVESTKPLDTLRKLNWFLLGRCVTYLETFSRDPKVAS